EAEIVAVFERWGLHHATIGEVVKGSSLQVWSGDRAEADLPVGMLVNAPTYTFPVQRPHYLDEVQRLDLMSLPLPDDLDALFLELLASPNIASRAPIFRRYDHMVGTNTVVQPGGDAAVLRIKGTTRGIALATDGNGRLCYLEPREGGRIAVAEAARNVSCVGAEPIALTDCLNLGSPQDPAVYYQLTEVIEGLAEACQALGIPVVSGNVSLYNESAGAAIWPTPVVGMLGLLPDLVRRCDVGFRGDGDVIVLLGDLAPELAGSEYLSFAHGRVAGRPHIDLVAEVALQRSLREAIGRGLLCSAHDCSDGGIAVAIAESAFRGGMGADCGGGVLGDGGHDRIDAVLFGEAQSRAVVTVAPDDLVMLQELAADAGVACTRLGVVGGERLAIGPVDVPLEAARAAWAGGLDRSLFGEGEDG
ncbi:MAG TPA: AIR synthase related protein, partial [Candidatus Limnocylindrales bacterium]|nr:AIR synthase related protein [Candidatus Limnocylindrales bacterium]